MQLPSKCITLQMWSAVVRLPGSGSDEFVSTNRLSGLVFGVGMCGITAPTTAYDELVDFLWLVSLTADVALPALQYQMMDDLAEFNMLHVSCCCEAGTCDL
ncbi:hypothetical protein Nepgr_007795 [Nepenthes gracilis]|uniref:Uncharacterized protein n=1 Tax=Nepenthes gracilis TaxID=150966 RepID=A0AAD3XIS8_NEPGR|nr:hypothetical protein Nepgr_007795 [Nepenthes gracilis]